MLENIYRSVNIGLINELHLVCKKMKINIFDPYVSTEVIKSFGGNKIENLDMGIQSCDYLSLHTPLNDKTKNMINPLKFFQEVKQEAFRITWPTKKETMMGAVMVFALSTIAAIFFLILDQILRFFLNIILTINFSFNISAMGGPLRVISFSNGVISFSEYNLFI